MDRLAREDHTAVISCEMGLKYNPFSDYFRLRVFELTPFSLTGLVDRMWDELDLVRVYTKPRGLAPDYSQPVVLRRGKCTVEDFCASIHKEIAKQMK